jgi:RimJ/RimL family protein N-acetyltransferase
LDFVKALETARLLIRRFSMAGLETAHQILDVEMQWDGPDVSLEQRRQALQRDIMLAEWNDGSRLFGFRGIFLKTVDQLIGLCGFHPWLWTQAQKALFWPLLFGAPATTDEYAYASFELSIGYGLSSRHRGQGYATEAANALIEYAFNSLQVKRVFADTNRSNVGSINVMKRAGMRIAYHPARPDEEWPDGPAVVGCIENAQQV